MLKVAEIFQDNMVLQQGKDLFIWGTAQKGSRVVIEIQDKHVEAAVDEEGNRIALSFVNADTGLVLKGETINALSIRSETGEIHYTFRIDQNRIILETEDLGAGEVSVAFAKTNWYCVNLYNQAGIPAVPFQISL